MEQTGLMGRTWKLASLIVALSDLIFQLRVEEMKFILLDKWLSISFWNILIYVHWRKLSYINFSPK